MNNHRLDTNASQLKDALLTERITEAAVNFFTELGFLDPRELRSELGGFNFFAGFSPQVWMRHTGRGEVVPVYRTEEQLAQIRDRCRRIGEENEWAICAKENRKNYVVGSGFTYQAGWKGDVDPAALGTGLAELPSKVQKVIDGFCEANLISELEPEVMERLDDDGEWIVRLFPQPSGLLRLRTVEPEQLLSPTGSLSEPHRTFGVETARDDIEHVVGYWIAPDPLRPVPAFVPAAEVLHVKLNVPRNAKRGLPTFYPVEANLRRAEDTLASMGAMAKARAKIALIRRFKGVLKDSAQAMLDSLEDAQATDPLTGTALSLEKWRYGTILNASDNIDYDMPGQNVDASSFVDVLQAELRAIAARVNMPEWMLTIKADMVNYASALVTEAPVVRSFQRLQRLLTSRFGGYRIPGAAQSLLWRQVQYAVRVGLLPRETLSLITITVDGPSMTVRDQAAEAQVNRTYFEMGVKGVRTIRKELGLKDEEEDASFREYPRPAEPAEPGRQPPAVPQPQGLAESVAALVLQRLREDASFESKHKRGEHGKFAKQAGGKKRNVQNGTKQKQSGPRSALRGLARAGRKAAQGISAAAHAVGTVEHAVTTRFLDTFHRLPKAVRYPTAAVFKASFASYLAAQKAAHAVAAERGGKEYADRVARVLTAVDLAGAKLGPLAAEFGLHAGHGAAMAVSFVPLGSLSYLAYSTATNPLATIRAARKALRRLTGAKMGESQAAGREDIAALFDALSSVPAEQLDWFEALLMAALDHTRGNLAEALALARRAMSTEY